MLRRTYIYTRCDVTNLFLLVYGKKKGLKRAKTSYILRAFRIPQCVCVCVSILVHGSHTLTCANTELKVFHSTGAAHCYIWFDFLDISPHPHSLAHTHVHRYLLCAAGVEIKTVFKHAANTLLLYVRSRTTVFRVSHKTCPFRLSVFFVFFSSSVFLSSF